MNLKSELDGYLICSISSGCLSLNGEAKKL